MLGEEPLDDLGDPGAELTWRGDEGGADLPAARTRRRWLPPFWAAIGRWLPPGAGIAGVRGIVYSGGVGAGSAVLVLAGYAVIGVPRPSPGSGRGQGTAPDVAPVQATAVPA